MRELYVIAREWAKALDVVHTKTFVGPGPHPTLEAFQVLEKELHDAALFVRCQGRDIHHLYSDMVRFCILPEGHNYDHAWGPWV